MHGRELLPKLDGFALVPSGAGPKFKAPLFKNWQNQAFTPDDIAGMNGKVLCVGVRCGPVSDNLLIVDIDGESAKRFLKDNGCDITDSGWRITRNNAPDRLKVAFQINDSDVEELLGERGKVRHQTGDAEQIELFWSKGQAIVLGDHKSSGGHYCWEGSPDQLGPPTSQWRDLLLKILLSGLKPSRVTATSGDWVDCIPCPICGRTESDCRSNVAETMVLCHHGKRWHPPQMKVGETRELSGSLWAFIREQDTELGRGSLFKIHEERPLPTLDRSQNGPVAALVSHLPSGWDEKGRPTTANAGALFTLLQQSGLADRFRYNLLTLEVELDGVELSPAQAENAYVHFQARGYNVTKQAAIDALLTIAEPNSFHPVLDYLNSLKDVPPVDISRLASQYFRPADLSGPQTIYDRFVQKTLVAAVARIMQEGVKHDTCCVLKGRQGVRKTSFWEVLFGEFFAVFRHGINDKDGLLCVHQSWGLELGELDNITSSFKAGALKNFLSTSVDPFRAPYGRKVAKAPRRSIFVGSCNRSDFLHDETGDRRFWVIPVELPSGVNIDIDALALDRAGIWKSALLLYRQGEQHWLTADDDAQNNELNQDFAADSWADDAVDSYLRSNPTLQIIVPSDLYKHVTSQVDNAGPAPKVQQEVKRVMARRHWTHKRLSMDRDGQNRPRRFVRDGWS